MSKPPFIYLWDKKMYIPRGKYVMLMCDHKDHEWEETEEDITIRMEGHNTKVVLTEWREVAKDNVEFNPLPETLEPEEALQLALDILNALGMEIKVNTNEN